MKNKILEILFVKLGGRPENIEVAEAILKLFHPSSTEWIDNSDIIVMADQKARANNGGSPGSGIQQQSFTEGANWAIAELKRRGFKSPSEVIRAEMSAFNAARQHKQDGANTIICGKYDDFVSYKNRQQ